MASWIRLGMSGHRTETSVCPGRVCQSYFLLALMKMRYRGIFLCADSILTAAIVVCTTVMRKCSGFAGTGLSEWNT